MLNGPYCPQYGLMIALPWAALTALHWQTSFVATLFFCLISSFLVEFTFAWLLRKTTHIRLRDYSKFKWNIKGYVSVPIATVRGVCFSFIVVFIVPVLTSLLHYVNRTVGWVILYAVLGIMLLDIIITSITVQRLNHQFKRLSELGDRVREARNALGNAVTGGAIGAAEAIDDLDLQKKLQEAQKTADENYTALLNKSNFLKRRFMSASPDMTNEQYEKELKAYRITTEERKKRSAERWKRNRYEYEATFENPEDRPFAFGMNFTKLFWIFFIGCLAGFVLEECWAFFIAHQIELRVGLVYGPFQPIYGGGAAIITLCLYKLYKQDDIVIFVASGIIGAAFEYLCSWGQEMLFGTVSWDYSGTPFNIDGRTNLMFALIWGTLGLIWIKEISPAMSVSHSCFTNMCPCCATVSVLIASLSAAGTSFEHTFSSKLCIAQLFRFFHAANTSGNVFEMYGASPAASVFQINSGRSDRSVFVNSTCTRSLLTWTREGASSQSACQVFFSIENPSWAEKRTARRIRSASSVNRSPASPTQRIRRAARSSAPPKISTIPVSWLYAIALIVKSRRLKSSRSSAVNTTSFG